MTQANLANGVTLEFERHGDPANPVIFIILGITDNITDWPHGLYQPLVEAGYCVICYELRDSGLSSKFEANGVPDLPIAAAQVTDGKLPAAGYDVHDMVTDARLLLEFLDIDSACVLGYSYGSMVAQLLALQAPSLCKGLVCLQGSNYNPALSVRTAVVQQAMNAATKDYDSIDERIATIKALRIATNGSIHALNEDEALDSAKTSVARMYYAQGTARIVLSRLATAVFFEQTCNISCPTLILQADEDPIFNLDHGEDMAARIPDSTLVVLRGAGHNHPLSLQPIIMDELIKFARTLFAG